MILRTAKSTRADLQITLSKCFKIIEQFSGIIMSLRSQIVHYDIYNRMPSDLQNIHSKRAIAQLSISKTSLRNVGSFIKTFIESICSFCIVRALKESCSTIAHCGNSDQDNTLDSWLFDSWCIIRFLFRNDSNNLIIALRTVNGSFRFLLKSYFWSINCALKASHSKCWNETNHI